MLLGSIRIAKSFSLSGYGLRQGPSSRRTLRSELGTERQPGNGRQVGGDLATRLLQHRETLTHQGGPGDAARVTRGVERRHDALLMVEYRYREGHDSVGELIFHRRVTQPQALLDQRA